MSQNYPGGDPSYPGDPNNPQTFPQQPGQPQPPQYPPQPTQPGYGQPPAYGQQPGYGQEQQPPPYQPPVYNQAAQPQYPQQQPPHYPQQPKKSNRGWIIGCSIAAVVVLLICGGIGVALYIGAQKAADAITTTGQGTLAAGQVLIFCTDFESQDYNGVYQLLSSAEQGRVGTPEQFAQRAATLDVSAGMVSGCQPTGNPPIASVSSDGKSATIKVEVVRSNQTGTASGTIRLVLENGAWKIDSADSSLKLF